MWQGKDGIMFDLVTRDALLVWNGELHRLEGPFESKAEAAEAAEVLKRRLEEASDQAAA